MACVAPHHATQAHNYGAQQSGNQQRSALGVAVVDLVPMYRDGLFTLIQRSPGLHWLGHATSHQSALQMAEKLRPRVIFIDSGIDPQCHLTKSLVDSPAAPLVVSLVREALRTVAYLTMVINIGTHAVLPRSADPRQLVEIAKRVRSGRQYVDPMLMSVLKQENQLASRTFIAQQPEGHVALSRREFQVLQLIAEGLENTTIATVLNLSVETVRTHVKSILRKLIARDRTHAVTLAFRIGILHPHTPAPTLPTDLPRGRPERAAPRRPVPKSHR